MKLRNISIPPIKYFLMWFAFFVTLLSAFTSPSIIKTSHAVIVDRIVAIVNSEIITLSALQEAELPFLKAEFLTLTDKKELHAALLQKMIDTTLQLQEAKKLGISATQEEVENTIKNIMNDNNIYDIYDFERLLEQQGVTLEAFKKRLAEEITSTKLTNQLIKSRIQITRWQIEKYYENHIEELGNKESVHIAHIFFRIPPNAHNDMEAKIEQKALQIWHKLRDGANFQDMAREYSEDPSKEKGGELGWFTKGQLVENLDKVAFSLNPGEISKPVKTKTGYHILKLIQKMNQTFQENSPLYNKIRSIVYKETFERKKKEWMESLRQKAVIKIYD